MLLCSVNKVRYVIMFGMLLCSVMKVRYAIMLYYRFPTKHSIFMFQLVTNFHKHLILYMEFRPTAVDSGSKTACMFTINHNFSHYEGELTGRVFHHPRLSLEAVPTSLVGKLSESSGLFRLNIDNTVIVPTVC